jgi:hypothetical protein
MLRSWSVRLHPSYQLGVFGESEPWDMGPRNYGTPGLSGAMITSTEPKQNPAVSKFQSKQLQSGPAAIPALDFLSWRRFWVIFLQTDRDRVLGNHLEISNTAILRR